MKRADVIFALVILALTSLAVAPLWIPRILPMQDYPQMLVLARAWGDCRDPASPFFGTYTTASPLSPQILPVLLLRAAGAVVGLETAGRILWTLYAVGLPAASLYLLAVLRRDRWSVLLVYPILLSYWVIGGFFAFATAAPLLVLGLALGVRWLEAPSWRRGAAFAAVMCAVELWHALVFAQLLLDFGVLWVLRRSGGGRARLRALVPVAPAVALFAAWMLTTFPGRPPGARPPVWPPLLGNAARFFEFIGPVIPGAASAALILALAILAGALAAARPPPGPFRLANPAAFLALIALLCFVVLPGDCFGVEGISNRQPWIAALLLVFGWPLPSRPALRAALLAVVGGGGALALVHLAGRFVAFDRESAGASRLIDRLGPGDTLLSPLRGGATVSFPGKPLAALEQYATLRHGGLPNSSFAGYGSLIVRYVGNKNPMPGLVVDWLESPALTRFDYVLLRRAKDPAAARPDLLQRVATDGDWVLYAVCGSRGRPRCL